MLRLVRHKLIKYVSSLRESNCISYLSGVAQNHSNLFMNDRQRMPGLQDGQVYTYPAKRWRKKRRQYLMHFLQPKRKENGDLETGDIHVINSNENPSVILNEDSKDSLGGSSSKDEPVSKVLVSHFAQ